MRAISKLGTFGLSSSQATAYFSLCLIVPADPSVGIPTARFPHHQLSRYPFRYCHL